MKGLEHDMGKPVKGKGKKKVAAADDEDNDSLHPTKATFHSIYEGLPEQEKVISKSLYEIVKIRRGNGDRDMVKDSSTLSGAMALHVTSWDWTDKKARIKNQNRDVLPLVQAISVEQHIVAKYRPQLLRDPLIGALHLSLQNMLERCVKKRQTLARGGGYKVVQVWKWWDGVSIPADITDAETMTGKLNDAAVRRQQQSVERHAMEDKDRHSIMQIVNHVSRLACAKASRASHSALAMDIIQALQDLVYVSSLFFIHFPHIKR